jgi:phage terminase large subunit GpA-like protein
MVFMTVDVQQDRLYYVVRGWSQHRKMESWLLDYGTIEGATNEQEVWDALTQFRDKQYGGKKIKRCFVDQKYRTQYVFAFCHAHRGWAFPAAGRLPKTTDSEAQQPLRAANIDVRKDGKVMRGGVAIKRWTINTDFFKRWVHDRLALKERGGFHMPIDTTDDYCQQLVSEARLIRPGGKIEWAVLQRANHYLDCEQMQVACAYSMRLQHYAAPLASGKPETASSDAAPVAQPVAPTPQQPSPPPPPQRRSGWMSRTGRGWMR